MGNSFLNRTFFSLLFYSLGVGQTYGQIPEQKFPNESLNLVNTLAPSGRSLTLNAALKAAQSYNPRIQAARQEYEITETDINLAKSNRRPIIEANASYGYIDQENSFTSAPESTLSGETSDVGLSLRQPLFRGFQTRNAIKSAESIALAANVQIKAIEQQVFLEVATAFLDVQRDFVILNLNLENLETLENQLNANEKRYQLKDTSLTDVARSKSAVASAYTQIANARASYSASQSTLFRLTGQAADNLIPALSTPLNLNSLETLITRAVKDNAAISSAQHSLKAAEYAVKQAKGARLPTIDFNSSLNHGERPENFGLFSDTRTTNAASANVSIRVPIYQAGQEFQNIHRAKQVRRLREIELAQTTSNVRDNVRIVWDQLEASKEALVSHENAVEAAQTAAVGTRKIYRSGLISAIDLIDTEQILLSAKINYEQAKRDLQVTRYNLLSIVGGISY